LFGLAGAAGLVLSRAPQAWSADAPLRFALTPVLLTSDLVMLDELKDYLSRSLGRPVHLVTRRTYQEITALLVSRQVDAAWICGYPFVAFRTELALVAVPVWKGRPLYQSYLIAGADSKAAGLSDLVGTVHAFSDPDSNSGFLVTAALLAQQGETPANFFRQFFYTYGHRNVVRAVAGGLAGSGSVDGYVYDVLAEVEPALVARTRIVTKSEPLGFPPIACAAANANTPAMTDLRNALVSMSQEDDGKRVLAMLRLDGFSIENPDLFDGIASRMRLVKGAGE
jgi:phosphonate transport system substrate-binding protein